MELAILYFVLSLLCVLVLPLSSCLTGVKAGRIHLFRVRVHLIRVAGNTV